VTGLVNTPNGSVAADDFYGLSGTAHNSDVQHEPVSSNRSWQTMQDKSGAPSVDKEWVLDPSLRQLSERIV